MPHVDTLEEEELLVLQARLSKRLAEYGYVTTLAGNQEAERKEEPEKDVES